MAFIPSVCSHLPMGDLERLASLCQSARRIWTCPFVLRMRRVGSEIVSVSGTVVTMLVDDMIRRF